jgi:fission process protein 1
VRYLGYANEVGESFKPIFPTLVMPSYVVAFAYCFADALYKTFLAKDHGQALLDVIRLGSDALLWQSLASVLIPGNIIAFITSLAVKTIRTEMDGMSTLPEPVRKWGPTIIGLACIPFIIEPIDTAVDMVFDNTIRAFWTGP